MRTVNIRKKTLHPPAVILVCAVLLCFLWQDGVEGFKTNLLICGSLTVVTVSIMVYEAVQLIRRKPVIAVSDYGIELMHQGSFTWEQIASFRFEDESDVDNYITRQLIFRLKDKTEIRLHCRELNKRPAEITDIINSFQNKISFEGHKRIGFER